MIRCMNSLEFLEDATIWVKGVIVNCLSGRSDSDSNMVSSSSNMGWY